MGRYLQAIEQPYVSMFTPDNIEFLDKKLMESQNRYDVTNAMYNQYVQEQLSKGYLDEGARQKYQNESNKRFKDVIKKHGYNLAEASTDLMQTVTIDKGDKYHRLNEYQLQQAAIEQELTAKYGPKAINRNPVAGQSLLDADGNYRTDIENLQANVEEASDYSAEALKLGQFLKNDSYSTALERAGLGYLKYSDISELTSDEVYKLASLPEVQAAFLANAPTAKYDNRAAVGYNPETNTNIFSTPEGITNYIYGVLASAPNRQEQTHYTQDVLALKQMDYAHDNRMLNKRLKAEKERYEPAINIYAKNEIIHKPMTDEEKKTLEGAKDYAKWNRISKSLNKNTFIPGVGNSIFQNIAGSYSDSKVEELKQERDKFMNKYSEAMTDLTSQGLNEEEAIDYIIQEEEAAQNYNTNNIVALDKEATTNVEDVSRIFGGKNPTLMKVEPNGKRTEITWNSLKGGEDGNKIDGSAMMFNGKNIILNAQDNSAYVLPYESLDNNTQNYLDAYNAIEENTNSIKNKTKEINVDGTKYVFDGMLQATDKNGNVITDSKYKKFTLNADNQYEADPYPISSTKVKGEIGQKIVGNFVQSQVKE